MKLNNLQEVDMKKRIKSFKYAIRGIQDVISDEMNMRIHLFIAVLVVICGLVFNISNVEWLVCVLCFAVVMTAEMINTAIETVVDLVSPSKHELARKAKDVAAGAVLLSAFFSAIAGLMIFVPKLLAVL